MVTPTLLRDLLRSAKFSSYADRLSLRVVLCGGSFASDELLQDAHEKLPETLTTALWGMTEGFGSASHYDTPLKRVFETVGKPFPGTELKILREDGCEAAAGKEGDLVLRGPQLFLGYFNSPELNEECFLPNRWFKTGDVAAIDLDGCLRITGRRKVLIIRGGANISPEEVEAKFQDDPRIQNFAVVGMPDDRLGERGCACIVLSQDCLSFTLADLQDIAKQRGLAKYKWPERVEIMDSLPLTSSNKIKRGVLREYVHNILASEKAQ
jgi:acyl-CoA synthetase (AMP-forming)/AMP-acid ligase II